MNTTDIKNAELELATELEPQSDIETVMPSGEVQLPYVGEILQGTEDTHVEEVDATVSSETEKEIAPKYEDAPGFDFFDNSNFKMKCSCGEVATIAENITAEGMNFSVPNTADHSLDVACPKCETKISFYFEEAESTDVPKQLEALADEIIENEVVNDIQEESTKA